MRKTDQSSGTTGPKDKKTKMGNQAEEKTLKWHEAPCKVVDFGQIKGDFVNMVEL